MRDISESRNGQNSRLVEYYPAELEYFSQQARSTYERIYSHLKELVVIGYNNTGSLIPDSTEPVFRVWSDGYPDISYACMRVDLQRIRLYDSEHIILCKLSSKRSKPCMNYGGNWSCPPHSKHKMIDLSKYECHYLVTIRFDLAHWVEVRITSRKMVQKYDPKIKDFSEGQLYNPRLYNQAIKKAFRNLIESLNIPDSALVLGAGACNLCGERCTRATGGVCRMGKPRYSMESVGIDVCATAYLAHIPLEWPPRNVVYQIGLICMNGPLMWNDIDDSSELQMKSVFE